MENKNIIVARRGKELTPSEIDEQGPVYIIPMSEKLHLLTIESIF